MTGNPPKAAGATSLRTGLQIINAVLEREVSGRTGFNVARLADEIGIERSKASRMTQELCDKGFLERSDSATLRVSHEFFTMPRALGQRLLARSRPVLRQLCVEFGASARLSIRDGVLVRTLRSESGADERPVPPSLTTPCWCTGTGRALLLDHDLEDIVAVLDGYELVGVGGPNAAHSAEELVRANERDRRSGIVTACDEFEHGITEYAVPIRDRQSHIQAAIAVVGRHHDVVQNERAIHQALSAAATSLSSLLDW